MNKLLTLGLSLENVIHDYKIVADSVVDDKTYQNADVGILLSNLDDVVKWLEELRELQEQSKWHLCEDGDLPTRYDDYYLCQLKGARNYGGNIQVCKFCQADKFKEHDYFDHMRNGFPNVIAWRELPKFEEVE